MKASEMKVERRSKPWLWRRGDDQGTVDEKVEADKDVLSATYGR